MTSRCTITRKANGRYYLGMDLNAAFALTKMLRCALASQWSVDCMGHEESDLVKDGGHRLSYILGRLEQMLQIENKRSIALTSTVWAIGRMKKKDGPVSPVRFSYGKPVTEADVRGEILRLRAAACEDWALYKHFDVWPVKDQS